MKVEKNRKEGTVVVTPEVQEKVYFELVRSANALGMSLEEYTVIASAVIGRMFAQGKMKITVL